MIIIITISINIQQASLVDSCGNTPQSNTLKLNLKYVKMART